MRRVASAASRFTSKPNEDALNTLEKITKFKRKELVQLHAQFLTIADRGALLSIEGFRQSLGILGMVQDSILCQRLFAVFNDSHTQLMTFEEFVRGLNVLVKGTVDEKLTFAFDMTDLDGSGEITLEELEMTVESIMRIYAGIMGGVGQNGGAMNAANRLKIRRMFRKLDRNGDGLITLEEYKRGMKLHPDLVAGLRGQDLFNSGIESALHDSNTRMRNFRRVSSSIASDVVEGLRMLDMLKSLDVSGNSSTSDLLQQSSVQKKQKHQQQPAPPANNTSSSEQGDDEITDCDSEEEDNTKNKAATAEEKRPFGLSLNLKQNRGVQETRSDHSPTSSVNNLPSLDMAGIEERLRCILYAIKNKAQLLIDENDQGRRSGNGISPEHIKASSNPSSLYGSSVPNGFTPMSSTGSQCHFSPVNTNNTFHDTTQRFRSGSAGSMPSRASSDGFPHDDMDFVMDAALSSPTHARSPSGSEPHPPGWESDHDDADVHHSSTGKLHRLTHSGHFASMRGFFSSGKHSKEEDQLEGDGVLGQYLSGAAKGSTVFFGHRNWDLVINVMKGIQMAVCRSAAEAARPLNVYDYSMKEKCTLVAGAKINKHSTKAGGSSAGIRDIDSDRSGRSCRFVDYAPLVFAKLREHWGIRNEDYIHSIGPGSMLSNLMLGSLSSLAELGSEGKSGSFFYFTSDGKFMVKTVHREEHKLLRSILQQYHFHMFKYRDSMLCRIVGCHVLRLSKHNKIGADKIYFVVMQNVLNTDLELHTRFDLKGSTVGRRSPEGARNSSKSTLKDLDLLEMGQRIRLGPERRQMLLQTLEHDSEFLREKQLIDYSLLLGIHNTSRAVLPKQDAMMDSLTSLGSRSTSASFSSSHGSVISDNDKSDDGDCEKPFFQQDSGGMKSVDGSETYVMGVIDFLTHYSTRKALERMGKKAVYGGGVSVAPPQIYKERFMDFMKEIVQ